MNTGLGVVLHAAGGFAAGSFYIPFKKVRGWAWESYWLVGGVFSLVIMPSVVAWSTVPEVVAVLDQAPAKSLFLSYLFGVFWGIGGLSFGLSVRYLGMSLGYAVALGFCAAFGTVIPPLFQGEFLGLLRSASGLVTLGGVAVCLGGIAVCGKAGMLKEGELSPEQKQETIAELNFTKGIWVAVFAGVMSACMAFAIAAGNPIAQLAVSHGTTRIWQNNPVFIVIFAGGFTTNCIWCVFLNIKNRTGRDYFNRRTAPILSNYLFSTLAGVTWYLQFLFYGMGTTQMGRYDFSSWTIHMAFIIVFSNMWGLRFHEWRGTSRQTHQWILIGILILIVSAVVVGAGNYLASVEP